MKVTSSGIVNGIIQDKYGKRGSEQRAGMPILSLPFEIVDAPKNTKSFAVIFDDPDSLPVCNHIWIHWLIANLHRTSVKENESETAYDFIQGLNSWHDNSYGGPCPPDKAHNYRFTVYALNDNLNLRGNFSKENLEKEMKGKIIESAEMFGKYNK